MRRAIINSISLNETPLGPSDNAASYNHALTSPPYPVIEPDLPSINNQDRVFVGEFQPYPSHSILLVACANPRVLGTGFLMDPTTFHPEHIPREATCMRIHDRKCVSERHRLVSSIIN